MLAHQPQIPLKLFWSSKDEIEPWLNKLKQLTKDLPAFNFNWQASRLALKQIIKEPDFKTAKFYISGPISLVVDMKKNLSNTGIASPQIFTDEFTGY